MMIVTRNSTILWISYDIP